MRIALAIVIVLPLAAQQPAPQQPVAQQPTPTASPVPATESWITGSIDLGYRWQTGVGGSVNTYRSVVDLGSGPKLLSTEFTIADPKARAFDCLDVRAYNFGDDPYATLHIGARKTGVYDLSGDYRNIAYFNNLPSYANPLLARGIVLNEQSFDVHRRFASFQAELRPGHRLIPYFAYERDSGSGSAVTTFVGDANEYAVPSRLQDRTNSFRGGVRFELRRFHATVEQGGTTFNDDEKVFSGPDARNPGNRNTPFLGQALFLSSLSQAYAVSGTSIYSKVLLTGNPFSWLDVYGQFLYSQPDSSVNFQQTAAGNLALTSQALFYNGQQFLLSSAANLPHTSGSFGLEVRPLRHVRVIQSWLTDRLDESGSASTHQTLTPGTLSQPTDQLLTSSLVTNYNQEQVDVLFELTSSLTVRGGYRFVWGDTQDFILPAAGLTGLDHGKLRRNVGLGGVAFHAGQRLSVHADVEGASSSDTYFRTSLHDYQKVRGRARYQLLPSLNISADLNVLNNHNPSPGIHFDYLAHQESLGFQWSPPVAKGWSLQGGYTRSTLRSDIGYLAPQDLHPERSSYRDNAHELSAMLDGTLPSFAGRGAKLTLGGSFFVSSGSRATTYYQPLAKLLLPVNQSVAFIGEWRYYGFGESFYLYEGFRTQLVTAGLRFTR
jgi:hypothetical protein